VHRNLAVGSGAQHPGASIFEAAHVCCVSVGAFGARNPLNPGGETQVPNRGGYPTQGRDVVSDRVS
jgi:hypothetical protein